MLPQLQPTLLLQLPVYRQQVPHSPCRSPPVAGRLRLSISVDGDGILTAATNPSCQHLQA
jgi:hypothetical protein